MIVIFLSELLFGKPFTERWMIALGERVVRLLTKIGVRR